MGTGHETKPVADATTCTHGGDHDAMHEEAAQWAKEWVARIRADAPPKTSEPWGAHERFVFADVMMRGDAIWDSVPEHLRACAAVGPFLVRHFLLYTPHEATPPPPECVHPGPDDEALHRDVEQWVAGWARRLYESCPALPGDGRISRPGRALEALNNRWNEVRASRPAHFAGCVFASHSMIRNTIYGINDETQ